MSRLRPAIGLSAIAIIFPISISNATPPAHESYYRIVKSVPLGKPDHWDYLTFDPKSDRVYVSHGDRITVVDGRNGDLIGNVEGMPGGTHGIAISHETGKGFTDDGRAGVAAAFDLKTLKIDRTAKAEGDADGVVRDPVTGHIFVIDGDSGKLTVIDPKTDGVLATIDAGMGLEFGVMGTDGKFYVNGAEKHEIVRVDTATNKIDAHWPMAMCEKPHGLAIDVAHRRLFSTCANKIMEVLDTDNGATVATLPIGQGSDAAAFDVNRQLVLSSNFDGTLSVIAEKAPDKYEIKPSVTTQLGARTMAIDPKSGRLYLVTADITVNPNAAPTDYHHRFQITPGSVRLLFLDPQP